MPLLDAIEPSKACYRRKFAIEKSAVDLSLVEASFDLLDGKGDLLFIGRAEFTRVALQPFQP